MLVARPISLNEDIRRKLEWQARSRSSEARVVVRSPIVLLAMAFKTKISLRP